MHACLTQHMHMRLTQELRVCDVQVPASLNIASCAAEVGQSILVQVDECLAPESAVHIPIAAISQSLAHM